MAIKALITFSDNLLQRHNRWAMGVLLRERDTHEQDGQGWCVVRASATEQEGGGGGGGGGGEGRRRGGGVVRRRRGWEEHATVEGERERREREREQQSSENGRGGGVKNESEHVTVHAFANTRILLKNDIHIHI